LKSEVLVITKSPETHRCAATAIGTGGQCFRSRCLSRTWPVVGAAWEWY